MAGTPSPLQQPELVNIWRENLIAKRHFAKHDDPSYFYNEPRCLLSQASVRGFTLGVGDDIVRALQPAIEAAESELIFITCFWARSESLVKLGDSLRVLSQKSLSKGAKIRVRIGLSSLSLLQKLFQTSNVSGKIYQTSEWKKKLGLPSPEELGGLDMEIKSVFVLPFSVMHPKFVIIDRKQVWLPSCNISWERWLEGCVVMDGPIVAQFLSFWQHFWARTLKSYEEVCEEQRPVQGSRKPFSESSYSNPTSNFDLQDVYAVFLPSPHHRKPRFSLPWQPHRPPPSTPLNEFLLGLISSAKTSIFIQTPNLTAPPVLSALLGALRGGINVSIVTSERLMILEQLVTAGTTTARCVRKLIKKYKRLAANTEHMDEEAALQSPGKLEVRFFHPLGKHAVLAGEQTHLKLTIVDEEWVVLGSGNMDRASWYTSQELGVAFQSAEMAQNVKGMLDQHLANRLKDVYKS